MMLLARARTTDAAAAADAPVLRTERLLLRAPRNSDAGAYALLAGDRRVAASSAHIPGAAEAQRPLFVITTGGELIGGCSLEGRDGVPEVWYWIGAPFWGCGYATEAVRGLVGHAFGALGHMALGARSRVSNPPSRRVLEKCGFRWTGVGLCRIRALGTSVPVDRFLREVAVA